MDPLVEMDVGTVHYRPMIDDDPYLILKANPYDFLQNWHDLPHSDSYTILKLPSPTIITFWIGISFILGLGVITFCLYHLRTAYDIKRYCDQVLHVTSKDLETIPWGILIAKVSKDKFNSIEKSNLTPFDLVRILMRRDNYFIAMFNKHLLNIAVPGFSKWKFITNIFEWCFFWSFDVFNAQGEVKTEYLIPENHDPLVKHLQSRFFRTGLISLIVSPFLLIILVIYGSFSLIERIRNTPSSLNSRYWTPYAYWKFRDFNEVKCLCHDRLIKALIPATKYVSQFQLYALQIVARFAIFVLVAIVAPLIILGIMKNNIYLYKIGHVSVVEFLGILGMILAVCRSIQPSYYFYFSPHDLMKDIVTNTHHLPMSWIKVAHTQRVNRRFLSYFQLEASIFIMEVISAIVTPFVFMFSLPKCASDVIQFLREMTIEEDGLGRMVYHSRLDIRDTQLSNVELDSNIDDHSCLSIDTLIDAKKKVDIQKMEMSIINFKANYSDWEPKGKSKIFLDKIISNSQPSNPDGQCSPLSSLPYENHCHEDCKDQILLDKNQRMNRSYIDLSISQHGRFSFP